MQLLPPLSLNRMTSLCGEHTVPGAHDRSENSALKIEKHRAPKHSSNFEPLLWLPVFRTQVLPWVIHFIIIIIFVHCELIIFKNTRLLRKPFFADKRLLFSSEQIDTVIQVNLIAWLRAGGSTNTFFTLQKERKGKKGGRKGGNQRRKPKKTLSRYNFEHKP